MIEIVSEGNGKCIAAEIEDQANIELRILSMKLYEYIKIIVSANVSVLCSFVTTT